MGFLTKFLQPLVNTLGDKIEIENLKKRRLGLDKRIDNLTRVTLNGEEEWMIKLVKKDPSCALRIIKECDKNVATR